MSLNLQVGQGAQRQVLNNYSLETLDSRNASHNETEMWERNSELIAILVKK